MRKRKPATIKIKKIADADPVMDKVDSALFDIGFDNGVFDDELEDDNVDWFDADYQLHEMD